MNDPANDERNDDSTDPEPAYDGASGRPPGYSEGPPEEGETADARRQVELVERQNAATGDATGMYGPGHRTADGGQPPDR